MDELELSTVVRAVFDKVKRELPNPRLMPGTVVGYASSGASATASVIMDGDETGDAVELSVIVPVALEVGDRVMVMFDPPQGAYVVGTLNTFISGAAAGDPSWSWTGMVLAGQRSSRYYINGDPKTLSSVDVSLIVAGTTTTTIRVFRGTGTGAPSSIQSVSLTSGVQRNTVTGLSIAYAVDQYVQVEIQVAGTGASGLGVQLGFV